MQKDYPLGAVLSTWGRHPDRPVCLPALRQAGRPEAGLEISRYANNASQTPGAKLTHFPSILDGKHKVSIISLSPSITRMSPFLPFNCQEPRADVTPFVRPLFVKVTSRVVCKIDYGVQTPILIQVMEYGKDYSL